MSYEISRQKYDELLDTHRRYLRANKMVHAMELIVELGTALDDISVLSTNRNWFHVTDQTLGTIAQDLVNMAKDESQGLLD